MSKIIGLDVGSKFIRTVVFDGELVFGEEPSAVAYNETEGKIVACGNGALSLAGRLPGGVLTVYPFKGKGMPDPAYVRALMEYFIKQTRSKGADVILSVAGTQSSATDALFIDALRYSGDVITVDSTLCAMYGSEVREAKDSLIVNIGATHTDIALYSNGKVVKTATNDFAGNKFDAAISAYLLKKYKARVTDEEAERIKIEIGSLSADIDGTLDYTCLRHVIGLPRKLSVSGDEISSALEPVFDELADSLIDILRNIPYRPDKVILTGGGAKLRGLDTALAPLLCLPIEISKEPEYAVIRGIGELMTKKR